MLGGGRAILKLLRLINLKIEHLGAFILKVGMKELKIEKKTLDVKNMFRIKLRVFMHILKRNNLPVNKPYFTRVFKIHNHLTRLETNNYIPRVNSINGEQKYYEKVQLRSINIYL